MSSRNRRRKRAATAEVELDTPKTSKQEPKTSEDEETALETQTGRPSRNRRKSAKLTEAEKDVKSPSAEPQRLGVISLHHEKGGKKDSEDSWTITSSTKPRRKSGPSAPAQDEEEESQFLHVVSKGKRQQTIKIKPLHKPEPTEDEKMPTEKPSSSRHAKTKKLRQRALPPITIKEESNVSVKEESGIKLKLILSPKDKSKSLPEVETSRGLEDKRSTSREKSKRSLSKDKEEHVKAKLVIGDQVLRVDRDKVVTAQSKKQNRGEAEPEQASSTPDSSKGNKRRKTSQPEPRKTPKTAEKPTEGKKSVTKDDIKVEPSINTTGKGSAKTSQKTPDRSGQGKNESKSRTKTKTPEKANSQSSEISRDEEKSKKKKSKSSKATATVNLLSVDESFEDLVIDESKTKESPKKAKSSKMDKKKKSHEPDDVSHKSKKHKSKDFKKQKAKFITTGTKKPGRSVGLDPVTASHMFGQFDSIHSHPQTDLNLKSSSLGLDDESFFMAGNDATAPSFSPVTDLMGLSGLGSFTSFGKIKKTGKKSGKKGDRDKKKKKKKEKLKKGVVKEKKPLTAYMLWCGHTRRNVVAQNPGLDFSGISRMMGTLWQQLPEKEKLMWYSKQRLQNQKHKNVPSLSKQKLRQSGSAGRGLRSPRGSPVRHLAVRTEPIDCAAHLKLLGESLALVGDRLQTHAGQVEVHGSLSVLLDSTLCALAPLMSLTSQVPQLNSIKKETIDSTFDNIAYIMPGLG